MNRQLTLNAQQWLGVVKRGLVLDPDQFAAVRDADAGPGYGWLTLAISAEQAEAYLSGHTHDLAWADGVRQVERRGWMLDYDGADHVAGLLGFGRRALVGAHGYPLDNWVMTDPDMSAAAIIAIGRAEGWAYVHWLGGEIADDPRGEIVELGGRSTPALDQVVALVEAESWLALGFAATARKARARASAWSHPPYATEGSYVEPYEPCGAGDDGAFVTSGLARQATSLYNPSRRPESVYRTSTMRTKTARVVESALFAAGAADLPAWSPEEPRADVDWSPIGRQARFVAALAALAARAASPTWYQREALARVGTAA